MPQTVNNIHHTQHHHPSHNGRRLGACNKTTWSSNAVVGWGANKTLNASSTKSPTPSLTATLTAASKNSSATNSNNNNNSTAIGNNIIMAADVTQRQRLLDLSHIAVCWHAVFLLLLLLLLASSNENSNNCAVITTSLRNNTNANNYGSNNNGTWRSLWSQRLCLAPASQADRVNFHSSTLKINYILFT